jgi:hypothetical protein
MKFDRYAGMASVVGILVILTLVTWLGLWGPVDISKLEKWQTLMTGVMALMAAGIAYRGATAKVRHDREVLANETVRRKLALYLKIEFAFRQLSEKARRMDAEITFSPLSGTEVIRASHLSVEEPPELEEAWTYLDMFPRTIIAEIRNVRNCLRRLQTLAAGMGDKGILWSAGDESPHAIISEAQSLMDGLWKSSGLVADTLDPLIEELAPEMDQMEKMAKIYGDPTDDE